MNSGSTENPSNSADLVDHFAEGVARTCRLYGVNPLLGRLYGCLFLSTEPRSLESLCEWAGAAKSTVSVALRQLLRFRVVRRIQLKGDRRDYYEANADLWAVLTEWNRLYFKPELDIWQEINRDTRAALRARPDTAETKVLGARLDELEAFMGTVQGALDALIPAEPPKAARTIPIRIDTDDGEGA